MAEGLTVRQLPHADYSRLAGTEFDATWHLLPEDSIILVVEVGDRIVACWSLLKIWHLEGLWMADDVRKSPAVGRRLLGAMRAEVKAQGAHHVLTASRESDAVVRQLLATVGAEELPVRLFAWPVGA